MPLQTIDEHNTTVQASTQPPLLQHNQTLLRSLAHALALGLADIKRSPNVDHVFQTLVGGSYAGYGASEVWFGDSGV